MTRLSKYGKPLGRPPKARTPEPAPIPANPRFVPANDVPDAQAAAIGRALLKFAAKYDAAGRGKRAAGWNPGSAGPNDVLSGLQMIRDRARDAVRNDWAGTALVQKWSTTLIGIGITPRFRRIKSKTRKQEIVDLWTDFVAEADADGVLNLYGLQTMVVRAWLESGEVFVRRRWRRPEDGFAVPVQLQVLEADMLPIFSASAYQGLPQNHTIKDGIEFNRRGRRIAYWFYKEHPGDQQVGSPVIGPDSLVRVLASDVCHVYEPARPGARRGVSVLAPVLMKLRSVGDYEDTTLERQKLANLWVGFITRTLPQFDPNDAEDQLSGLERVVDADGNGLLPLRPGLIQELEDGQDFKFANPPEAGTTYSDYMRTSHVGTSAGGGMPYEVMSGDIAGISDRTLRVMINEYRRFAEQRQWQIVIPQFCQRTVNWFTDAAVLDGTVGINEADDVRRVEHAPHGWAHIHPVQDPQGKQIEIEAGIRSRSSVIGESGDDPDTVDAERAEDDAREQTLKIGPYSAATVAANAPRGAEPAPDDEVNDPEDDPPPNARFRR